MPLEAILPFFKKHRHGRSPLSFHVSAVARLRNTGLNDSAVIAEQLNEIITRPALVFGSLSRTRQYPAVEGHLSDLTDHREEMLDQDFPFRYEEASLR